MAPMTPGLSFKKCLAVALRMQESDIPEFDANPAIGHCQLNKWLRQFNLVLLSCTDSLAHWEQGNGVSGLMHISQGVSARAGEAIHNCLYEDGVLVYDPHPDDTGLITVVYNSVLLCLDPGRFVHALAPAKTKDKWVHDCAMAYVDKAKLDYSKAEALALAALEWEEVEHEDDVSKYASPVKVALADMAEWQHP